MNIKGFYGLLIMVILIRSVTIAQQKSSFHGIVVDYSTEKPLEGVNIKTVHGNKNTLSNENGKFSFVADKFDTIVISHVGYKIKKMSIANLKDNGKVRLEALNENLEDVTINTGYQMLNPNEVNGSYVVIDNKTLNEQTGLNVLDRLNGVTSSLLFNIDKSNHNPQNETNINIRGLSTINGPLDPLIVVDNFIYNGDINNINPNDVESITILKDAAATSIWGARAGNGVIVITTKKGKFNEKLKIEFNSNIMVTEKPDLFYNTKISSSDYIDFEQFLFNQGYYNRDLANRGRPVVSPAVLIFGERRDGLISSQDSANQINQFKQIDNRRHFTDYYYQKGITQQYAINVRGGSKNIAWLVSGGFDKKVDNLRKPFDKINLRFENTYKLSKKIKINAGIYYTNSTTDYGLPDYFSLTNLNHRHIPYLPLVGQNGASIAVPREYNSNYIDTAGDGRLLDWHYYPLEEYKHYHYQPRIEDLLAHVGLNYQIFKGLDFALQYQYEKQYTVTETYSDTSSYNARTLINKFSQIDPETGVVTYNVPLGGIMSNYYSTLNSYNFRGQLNFSRSIRNTHHLNAIVGMEVNDKRQKSSSVTYYGYNEDPLTAISNLNYNIRYPTYITGSYSSIGSDAGVTSTTYRFVSFFGNASYAYKNKYILSGSFRKDGSNIFGVNTNDKWNPLWSAGIGWNISKEAFYNIPLLSYLKVSATYGVSGNVDLSKSAVPIAQVGIDGVTGLRVDAISALNNPELRWEKSYQTNLRIEFGMNKELLSGSVEYYHKKGVDLYAPAPFDYTAYGRATTIVSNVADMAGNGIDISLHSNNLNRKLKWTSDLLLNYNTSKTTAYFTPESKMIALMGTGKTITPIIGMPLYAIGGFKWGGLNNEGNPQGYLNDTISTDYTAILQNSLSQGLKNGSFKYIGPANPEYFGSIMNSFSFKGFSLSFNITFKLGYYFQKPALSYRNLASNGINGGEYSKRWQKPGDEMFTNIPAFVYPSDLRDEVYSRSEVNVLRGDHFRLQFLNLGYSFFKGMRKLPFKSIQLYINAANLGIIWRANSEHIDPDFVNDIPAPKRYSIGIRASF